MNLYKLVAFISFFTITLNAQMNKIEFTEFTLENGLHVILHEDHSNPIVAVAMMYHVGSKNEKPERTGMAHFFEHLLFEGSEKIMRDFIFIDDVIQANIKACAAKISGVYNVGTGISRNFQEIADILQKELNTDLGTEYFPNPYNGYQMNTQADMRNSKEYLGFESKFTLEKGINAYVPEILRLHNEDSS